MKRKRSTQRYRRAANPVILAILVAMLPSGCTNDTIPEPDTQPVIAGLRAAANSACVSLETEGTSFCWGANEFGQVGNGLPNDQLRPSQVVGAPPFSTPFPGDHACASGENGLYCWGRNSSGEVGNGSTDPVPVPALVSGGLTFQQVAIGDDFTCGIATSGVTYCWGANDVGQLGTGTPGNSSVPVAVAGDPQILSLAAGGRTACGVLSSGGMVCWGNGADGELGNGQFGVSAAVPELVAGGLELFAPAIGANAAGQATVCASTLDAAYCWGKNSDGEIGDGTTERKNLPTPVTGLPGGVQMAPGGSHTCARTPDAAAFCWGRGGELGTGDVQPSTTPVAVKGGIKFAAVYSGRAHSCGRTDAAPARAFCWGVKNRGQLGDGTRITRLEPTLVTF